MERCDAAFKKEVLLICYGALAERGFIRFRKENVDLPLEDGFHCWVGLNTGLHDAYVEINPFVGIHAVQIEKLWTSLKNGKYPAKYDRGHATYAIHVGEIAPERKAFRFQKTTNIFLEARRLADLYYEVGVSYAKSIANYVALLPLLRSRIDRLGAYPERFASCLFLMGQVEGAKKFTIDFLVGHKDYFEGFALPFLDVIEKQETLLRQ